MHMWKWKMNERINLALNSKMYMWAWKTCCNLAELNVSGESSDCLCTCMYAARDFRLNLIFFQNAHRFFFRFANFYQILTQYQTWILSNWNDKNMTRNISTIFRNMSVRVCVCVRFCWQTQTYSALINRRLFYYQIPYIRLKWCNK